MTTLVLGVENVHAGAALCDYLADRIGPDDVVYAVHSASAGAGGASARDGDDALNVVSVRLAPAEIRTRRFDRGNAPAEDLLRCADEVDADEIVLGLGGGNPDAADADAADNPDASDGSDAPDNADTPDGADAADGLGDTVPAVLRGSSRPVAVVPA